MQVQARPSLLGTERKQRPQTLLTQSPVLILEQGESVVVWKQSPMPTLSQANHTLWSVRAFWMITPASRLPPNLVSLYFQDTHVAKSLWLLRKQPRFKGLSACPAQTRGISWLLLALLQLYLGMHPEYACPGKISTHTGCREQFQENFATI